MLPLATSDNRIHKIPTPKSPSKTNAEIIITTPAKIVGSNFSPGLNVNKHSNGWKNALFST